MLWSPVAREYDPLKAGSIDATDTEPHDHGVIRALNSKYKPNKDVVSIPEHTIFVGRLHPNTTEEALESLFSNYGDIKRLRLVRDIVTGHSRGYAFVEYETEKHAYRACKEANKLYIDDCEILVDFECERTLKGWKPRRLGGGLSGKKESGQLRFGGIDRPFRKPLDFMLEQRRDDNRQKYRERGTSFESDKKYEKERHRYQPRYDRSRNKRSRSRSRERSRRRSGSRDRSRSFRSRSRSRDRSRSKRSRDRFRR